MLSKKEWGPGGGQNSVRLGGNSWASGYSYLSGKVSLMGVNPNKAGKGSSLPLFKYIPAGVK